MAEFGYHVRRTHVAVEGKGELSAAHSLLMRISQRLGLPLVWAPPRRRPVQWGTDLLLRIAASYRSEPRPCEALLLLRDADDDCPREHAPGAATRLRELALPFPVAFVMLNPEYEVMFLPCLDRMTGVRLDGRPGLRPGSTWNGAWERKRGLKEALSAMMPQGHAYKPTVDQLAFTRMIDLEVLAAAGVHCFGTLERAVTFLSTAGPGEVYPPPS